MTDTNDEVLKKGEKVNTSDGYVNSSDEWKRETKEAAAFWEYKNGSRIEGREVKKKAFKAGADFGYEYMREKANVRERRYMDIDGENRLLSQQLEAERAEVEKWKTDYVTAIKMAAKSASKVVDAHFLIDECESALKEAIENDDAAINEACSKTLARIAEWRGKK